MEIGGNELAKVLTYYGYEPDIRSGKSKLICPFHGDVNASMVASFEDGRFHCFGCECSGDAYDFVREMNPSLNDLQCWSLYMRILFSNKVSKVKVNTYRKKRDSSLDDIAHDYYYCLSVTDWNDIHDEDGKAVLGYMKDRGFTERTLNRCGARLNCNAKYPVIFPMMDNGKFMGWVCRTTDKEVEKERKYLYNKGFSRETTLLGNYGRLSYVVVVEGYMDRLKMVQNGLDNVVAVLGWKMTRTQEEKLKAAGVHTIISALDNDECGRKGTEYLKTRFKNVYRFRYLKGIKDPGQMTSEQFWRMYARTMEEIAML